MAEYIVGFQMYHFDDEDDEESKGRLSEELNFISGTFSNLQAVRNFIYQQVKQDDLDQQQFRYTIYQILPILTGEGTVHRVAKVNWTSVNPEGKKK